LFFGYEITDFARKDIGMTMQVTLRQARTGFKLRNQTENKSKRTTVWYDDNIERLEAYFKRQAIDEKDDATDMKLASITSEVLRDFISYLQSKTTQWENHPFHPPVQKPLFPYTIRGIVLGCAAKDSTICINRLFKR
jgi:hypothetical protein